MSRFNIGSQFGGMISLAASLGLSVVATGCSGDYDVDSMNESFEGSEAFDDTAMSDDDVVADEASSELGTSEQALFWNPFNFTNSCSDTKGTNSVMAALAVATATELRRWQPNKDFASSWGVVKLTATGKAQCADGKCWNTQAILDLQNAPAGKVQIRPGVLLDSRALRSTLSSNLVFQIFSLLSFLVPEHRFELMYSEKGGCDQFYWFNVKSPSGGALSSYLVSTLEQKLTWVGGNKNPYIQFESNGSMVGIDPTYGLNQTGSTSSGSCIAACTKMSSTNITGTCCSCNGTKKFARSAWSPSTYLCL